MTTAVALQGVIKRFGRTTALDGLDLTLERGEVFGLIGPNGAGKTTTLRLLLDILRPTAGTVRVLGADPRAAGATLRERIGYLPGELRLDGRARVRELLAFYAEVSGGVSTERVRSLAERFDLDLSRRIGGLSKGNKQKVGLVQAFMHAPELLVLDEPTSGLDPLVQQQFLDLVREAEASGQTVLLSTHVLSEVQHVARRVAILRAGRVVRLASVDELRAEAPRRVRVVFPQTEATAGREALGRLPGMTSLEQDTSRPGGDGLVALAGRFTGAPAPLLNELHGFHVADVVIAEPDLEEAVLALYRSDGSGQRVKA